MENGYGKTTPAKEYKVQKRAGSGIKTAKITPKTGNVIGAAMLRVSVMIALAVLLNILFSLLLTLLKFLMIFLMISLQF